MRIKRNNPVSAPRRPAAPLKIIDARPPSPELDSSAQLMGLCF
jgi:hypothetical protein